VRRLGPATDGNSTDCPCVPGGGVAAAAAPPPKPPWQPPLLLWWWCCPRRAFHPRCPLARPLMRPSLAIANSCSFPVACMFSAMRSRSVSGAPPGFSPRALQCSSESGRKVGQEGLRAQGVVACFLPALRPTQLQQQPRDISLTQAAAAVGKQAHARGNARNNVRSTHAHAPIDTPALVPEILVREGAQVVGHGWWRHFCGLIAFYSCC